MKRADGCDILAHELFSAQCAERGTDMKKLGIVFLLFVESMAVCFVMPLSDISAEDLLNAELTTEFSDAGSSEKLSETGSSVSLLVSAWEALKNNDVESVLDFTNECINRYGKRARQMQAKLDGYVDGTGAEIRSHWALNDVATALFIQGKALQNAGRYEEARTAYQRLIDEYTFGQCWDPKGWFWKPAEVAQENLTMIETGVFYDFGDYSSATLVTRAWESLEKEDLGLVLGYADKCIKLYGDKAREMQAGLADYPQGSDDELFAYWALNDVATAHFIKGRAYMMEGRNKEAAREFQTIRDDFSFGQCWDPRGWWWKPVTEAENWLEALSKKE